MVRGQARLRLFMASVYIHIPEDQLETKIQELDLLQGKYKAAVEEWVSAIRHEEALASGNHAVAEIDKWKAVHFAADEIRGRVKAAKSEYEGGLRKKLFDF